MGIQINGNTDIISATDGSLTVNGLELSTVTTGNFNISGVSTFTNGPVLIGSGTSTGTASQRLQVTGGAYVSGNLGLGVASPSSLLDLSGGQFRIRSSGTFSDPTDNAGVIAYDSAGGDFTISARSSSGSTALAFRTSSSGTSAEKARIDSSGRVTMPYQPCWSANAGASNNFSSGTVTLCSSSTNSTSITTNVGSHFSASTGRFTAPVAGNYFFIAEFSPGNAASGPAIFITKNGTKITSYSYAYSVAYGTASISVVANCAVNDYLEAMVIAFNSVTTSVYGCNVSGFLIG